VPQGHLYKPPRIGYRTNVGHPENHRTTLGADPGRGALQLASGPCADDQAATRPRKALCDGGTEAAPGSGDQGNGIAERRVFDM
jgi:hypothetical protein